MINALVVDDERMVRKGFQSLTDWKQYDISFVGEAKDGLQALHFLSKQQVDVMFVDITMPNMNGFELMKRVQEQYPEVEFVILTCHHEFNYVQEALQLGAIDYIVKTLLNRENVDETITRIMSRLKRDKGKKVQDHSASYRGGTYLILKAATNLDSYYMKEHLPGNLKHIQMNNGILKLEEDSIEKFSLIEQTSLLQYAHVLQISSCEQLQTQEVERWLSQYFWEYYFYTTESGNLFVNEKQLIALLKKSQKEDSEEKKWIDELNQYRWLLYPQEWSRWQRTTVLLKPKPEHIISLVDQMYGQLVLTMKWEHDSHHAPLAAPDTSRWIHLEQWLAQLSLHLRGRMTDLSLSHDIVICMIKAIHFMNRQIGYDLNQNEIAYQVGMSRSYFSQCFKRFFGVSFGDVLRHIRIETAKKLLVSTQQSISEIANQIGFDDHKYFSRTFKAQIGLYPTEYRSLHYEVR